MKLLVVLFLSCVPSALCYLKNSHLEKLVYEKNDFGENMKVFIKYMVRQVYSAKNGFLLTLVNEIDFEKIEFCLGELRKYSVGQILNFAQSTQALIDVRVLDWMENSDFKFVLIDPFNDVSDVQPYYMRLKNLRIPTAIIFTKRPPDFMIPTTLNMYATIKSLNVIIAYEENNTVKIFTINPYLNRNEQIVTLSPNNGIYFQDKTKNLYGFKIRGLLTNNDKTKIKVKKTKTGKIMYTGKDALTIEAVIKYLNGTLEIININDIVSNNSENPWNNKNKMENLTVIKENFVKKHSLEMLIKSEMFKPNDPVFENIYPHTTNDLHILVVTKIPTTALDNFFSFPSPGFLAVYWLVPPAITVISYGVRKVITKSKGTFITALFISFQIAFTNTSLFKAFSHSERIILVFYLLYCYLINVTIQSRLTSFLSIAPHIKHIDTVDEFFKNLKPIYTYRTYQEELQKKYNGTIYSSILKYLKDIDDVGQENIENLEISFNIPEGSYGLDEKDRSFFITRSVLNYDNGKPKYHLMKESIMPSYQSFKLKYGSPIIPNVNKIMRRLSEAGLIDLWNKVSVLDEIIKGNLYPEIHVMERYQELTINSMGFCFYILIIAYCLAFCVFLGELITYRYFFLAQSL